VVETPKDEEKLYEVLGEVVFIKEFFMNEKHFQLIIQFFLNDA
jgi:hypothetical protein